MKSSIEIIKNIIKNWKLSRSLARNDFRMKFAGSYLGVVWAFIQPVVTVLVYWFVFQVGLRHGTVGQYPYVVYLIAGLMPWFFIADALSGGASAFTDYNYLVKQVVFNISILPFVKIVSAFYVHIFFALVTIIILALYGFPPDFYDLQIVYYMFCSFVLVLGLSYLFSSMVVFARDVKQIINIFVIQIGVWITPIMWDAQQMLSPRLQAVFKLNPFYYITEGYRDALLYKHFFWESRPRWTLYFWAITILLFIFGARVYKRSKPSFADLL